MTNITLTSIATPTDVVTADTITNLTTYAALSNTNILDHPDTSDLLGGSGVIQETKYAYDPNQRRNHSQADPNFRRQLRHQQLWAITTPTGWPPRKPIRSGW